MYSETCNTNILNFYRRCVLFFILLIATAAFPQRVFTNDILLKATPVKDQSYSSTCWSFATTSFIESELIRMGKGEYDLSEMFFVWNIYPKKTENYIRWHGKVFLTPGGQPHDVMKTVRTCGLVPQQAYKGKNDNSFGYDHSEMDTTIRKIANQYLAENNPRGFAKLDDTIQLVLKTYLGDPPVNFEIDHKSFTPLSFAKYLGVNPDEYPELTSYTHHPYYTAFVLETPYNWSHDLYYNLPYDDFFKTIDFALSKGFTVLWNGDVSEDEFSFDYGLALVPSKKWNDKSPIEQKNTFLINEKEIIPTPELRQQTFESLDSKVDHVMHIIGTAHDQDGKKYYIVKNSWGLNDRTGGLIYMSEAYLKLKTISIMLNKDGIPSNITNKIQWIR